MEIRKKWVAWEELEAILGRATWTSSTNIDAGQVGGLNEGSIPFADSDGFLTEDDPNFFWDAVEKNLGIGTNTFGATMTQGIQMATGLAPTANVADTFAFFSKDFAAGNACPHFRTENGTVIGLNQSLFTTDNVNFGTIGCGKLTVDSGIGQAIIIKGTSTGDANKGWIGFYDSNGTTRRGYVGDSSDTHDDIVLAADTGNVRIVSAGGNVLIETLTLADGSITDSSGAISFGDDNIQTSGYIGLRSSAELRFYDNGNYVGFEAPALAGDQIWVLPNADGALGEHMVTDGAGNLSWTTGAGTGDVSAAANIADHSVVRGNGGAKGIQESTAIITDAGEMYNPLQPAFLAYNSVNDADVTGDATYVAVDFDTEIFDQGGDFAANTFTAPVDGKYLLLTTVLLSNLNLGSYETTIIRIITSNRTYYYRGSGLISDVAGNLTLQLSVLADMDADDTAYIEVRVSGGARTVDIYGGPTMYTYFSGALIC